MTVVGYDPVAGTIFVHSEGKPPGTDKPTGGVVIKHYQDEGILYLTLRDQLAELFFVDMEGRYRFVSSVPAGSGWLVVTGH